MADGCGATHLVLALANYFQSVLGRKTAVLELSAQRELDGLVKREADKEHKILGVQYYTEICMGQIPDIVNGRHEVFILDFGSDFPTVREEFLRCDRKIVLGSTSPWKIISYEHFIMHIIALEEYSQWKFLTLFGDWQSRKMMQKRCGIHMVSMPYLENPFALKKEDLKFLQKII